MAGNPVLSAHSADSLLGLQEAADRLGVHYMTVYRYVRTGRLPARRIGSQWRVDPRDLGAVAAGSPVTGRPRAETQRASRAAVARRLEDRLVAGDEPGAWTIVEGRLSSGSDPDEILLDGLGEAMRSVGQGWEAGEYTVDDEHRAAGVATRRRGPTGISLHGAGVQARQRDLGGSAPRAARAPDRHGCERPARPRLRSRRPRCRCPCVSLRQRSYQGAANTGGGRRCDHGKPRSCGAGDRASRSRREPRPARSRRRSCHRRRGACGSSGSGLEWRRRTAPR